MYNPYYKQKIFCLWCVTHLPFRTVGKHQERVLFSLLYSIDHFNFKGFPAKTAPQRVVQSLHRWPPPYGIFLLAFACYIPKALRSLKYIYHQRLPFSGAALLVHCFPWPNTWLLRRMTCQLWDERDTRVPLTFSIAAKPNYPIHLTMGYYAGHFNAIRLGVHLGIFHVMS